MTKNKNSSRHLNSSQASKQVALVKEIAFSNSGVSSRTSLIFICYQNMRGILTTFFHAGNPPEKTATLLSLREKHPPIVSTKIKSAN